MIETTIFDPAEHLNTPHRQAEYMNAALETGELETIRDALSVVARARGMSDVARQAGVNRESLYKALSGRGNPEFGTILAVMKALGLTLSAHPADGKGPRGRTAA